MHVGVLRGEYFYNITLRGLSILIFLLPAFKTVANWRGLFNIINLEEQRKTSRVKNKLS